MAAKKKNGSSKEKIPTLGRQSKTAKDEDRRLTSVGKGQLQREKNF